MLGIVEIGANTLADRRKQAVFAAMVPTLVPNDGRLLSVLIKVLVGAAGLEPASLAAEDFKNSVMHISGCFRILRALLPAIFHTAHTMIYYRRGANFGAKYGR